MPCKGVYETLKDLNISDNPPWRNNTDEKAPTTSQMLQSIASDSNSYNTQSPHYKKKLEELKSKFILNSNLGENEGTLTMESTKIALEKINDQNVNSKEQVSINLLRAMNHLIERNSGKDKGLLEVEECIQDTHKILMKNLLPLDKCGRFSTERRIASDDDHEFPKFDTEEDAFKEVQTIVDDYNSTIDYIKNSDLEGSERCLMYFKSAAWILFKFVDLHPFSDGNGRMCRLLASRCLYLIFPFPCPIYNIYAPTKRYDYLSAIKTARAKDGKDVGDLVALLIESGWHTSKYFHELLSTNQLIN